MKTKFAGLLIASLACLLFLAGNAWSQGFSSVLEKIDEIEMKLNNLDLSQKEDFQTLEEKISGIESVQSLDGLENTVTILENQVSKLSADVNELSVKNSGNAPSVDTETLAALTGDLKGLMGELQNTLKNAPKDALKHDSKTAIKGVKSPVKLELKAYSLYQHDATEGDGRSNSFDISRVYIGAKYTISSEFHARYLTDIKRASGGGKFEVYTKYAYLDWKLSKYNAKLTFGLQGLQIWKQPEKAWGYRVIRYSPAESFGKYWGSVKGDYKEHLSSWADALLDTTGGRTPSSADIDLAAKILAQEENFSIASRSKMGSSADMGFGINLKLSKTSYANFIVRNGTGYKSSENDMYKNFQLRVGNYFLEKALHVSAFVEIEPFRGVEKVYKNFQWDLFASYKTRTDLLIGVDVNSKVFAGSLEDITAMNYSVFGNFYLKPNVKALARYDQYITGFNDVSLPSGATALKTNANLLILGIDFIPEKHIHIIPNVQIQTYEDPNSDKNTALYLHLQYKL